MPGAPGLAPPRVFLVEDSAVHARFLSEALRKTPTPPEVRLFTNAETAWPVIHDLVRQPRASWPRLAILDLGLPGASGVTLLERIRKNPAFDDWPVVMLTASRREDDVDAARGARASGYYVKPIDVHGYQRLAQDLAQQWLGPPAGAADPASPAPPKSP